MRLVSYQRDLGVWIFPGMRRFWFFVAISLRCMLLFVPRFFFFFLFFFFFESYDYCFRVQNLACSLRYGIK